MKIKKISTIIMLITLLFSSNTYAEDTYLDNNALNNLTEKNDNIVINEVNTGKIISKKNDTTKISTPKLANYLAVYLLSNDLKEQKITLDSKIKLINNDEILNSLNITNEISVKDAIFLLENKSSAALTSSIMAHYSLNVDNANEELAKLSLVNTKLASFDINDNNISTAKDIAYLTNISLKNYPEITDITKNQNYDLTNGTKIDNNIKFINNEKFRVTGLDFNGESNISVAYSGNTKLVIVILKQNYDKETFFDNLQKTFDYLFTNYNYKLALKAGTYKINNENITLGNDLYDLFYSGHSIKDVTYLLMNKKILLFQRYETISANEGTVFSDFTSDDDNGKLTKVTNTFINDSNFSGKSNIEKTTIVINRTKQFAAAILTIYCTVFIFLHITKKAVRKD